MGLTSATKVLGATTANISAPVSIASARAVDLLRGQAQTHRNKATDLEGEVVALAGQMQAAREELQQNLDVAEELDRAAAALEAKS
jgi:uncharacterized coiled-coil DUF342 family protein